MRDYAATAHVHAGIHYIRGNWPVPDMPQRAGDQVYLATLHRFRGRPLIHAYLLGFGDVA